MIPQVQTFVKDTAPMPTVDLADKLRQEVRRAIGSDHGAQMAFANAIEVPKGTLSAFLSGIRPGTGQGRHNGDNRTLLQKLHQYAKEVGNDALVETLVAYYLDDPSYLPPNGAEEP